MPGRKRALALITVAGGLAVATSATAQDVEAFYRGKTIRLMIGANVGGGYDAYARLVGRHIGKYIPGRPAIVPSNVSGAGGNTVLNYVYAAAPRDGTVLAATSPGSLLDPLLGDKTTLKHDPLQFNYIGSATGEVFTCMVRVDAAAKSFEDVLSKEEVILGSSGGTTHDMPRALVNVLGAKFKLISGYRGTLDIALAMERGEVQGICGQGYANISWQRPDWFRAGSPIRVLAQESITGDPELNKRGVPLTLDFAKTPEQRQILEIVYAQGVFTRPFVMAPDVPKERVEAIRTAFIQALADPELLADAQKQSLSVGPLSGVDLDRMIRKIYATAPDVVEKVRKAIVDQ
jgi:tripartite-type tricarboxylate transporter receptor subunit TctC